MAEVALLVPDSLTGSTWEDEDLRQELDSLTDSMWKAPSVAEALRLAPDSLKDST